MQINQEQQVSAGVNTASKITRYISAIFVNQVSYYCESCFQNCTKLWWT